MGKNFEKVEKLFNEMELERLYSHELSEVTAELEKRCAAAQDNFEKLFIMQLQSAIFQACMIRNASATCRSGAFSCAKGNRVEISDFQYRPNKNGSGFCITVYYGTENSEKVFIEINECLENCYRIFHTLMLEFKQEIVLLDVPGETNMFVVARKKF